MDALFQSYNANISLASFESLSSCTINWLEQYCKPQVIPWAPPLISCHCISLNFFLQILKDLLTRQLHIAQLTSTHHMYTSTQSSLHWRTLYWNTWWKIFFCLYRALLYCIVHYRVWTLYGLISMYTIPEHICCHNFENKSWFCSITSQTDLDRIPL